MASSRLEGDASMPFGAEDGLVELVMPAGRSWEPVMRLVLGGMASHLDLRFDQLDDLQLAVERLLAEAGPPDTVRLSFEVTPAGIRARVGPLSESVISAVLQGPRADSGRLDLRRILETVVDSFGIEMDGDDLNVRLEKATRGT